MLENMGDKISQYLPYLEDLQRRVYRGVILFVIIFLVGFLSSSTIFKHILEVINVNEVVISASSPFQFADLAMDTGLFLAIVIVIPYFAYSFYSFISPALSKKEKRFLFFLVPLSIGLFVVGFSYGFFVLYYALQLLADINTNMGIKNIWNISEFMIQIFMTSAFLGIIFEYPIILTFLIKTKIMEVDFLKKKRRIAYFLVFCMTSLLPPTDGLSLIVMSLPLVLLYEVTVLFNNNNK